MKSVHRFAVVLLLAVGAVFPAAAQNRPTRPSEIPVSAFFDHPNIRGAQLSPDGSMVAFLFPVEGRLAIGLFNRTTKEASMVIRGTDESILSFLWKGNDRILFFGDVGGNERFFYGAVDLDGRRVRRLAESQENEDELHGSSAGLLGSIPRDTEHVIMSGLFTQRVRSLGEAPEFDSGIFRVNVNTGARQRVVAGDRSLAGFLFDFDGNLRAQARLANQVLSWEVNRGADAEFQRVSSHPLVAYAPTFNPLGFDGSGTRLWVESREAHDRGALHTLDTETMQLSEALFVPPAGEMTGLVRSGNGERVLGVAYEDDRLRYHWFDQQRAELQRWLEGNFPGMQVQVTSSSWDDQIHMVLVSSDRDAGTYYILDIPGKRMEPFRRINSLDPALLAPMESVTYTARDGVTIQAYLTRPLNSEGRRVPLIINPHGGPFGVRDSWGFNNEVQFLASRGYAVLQPNYRGSGGFGQQFLLKGQRQWGRAMQDDLTDGVRWAIEQGITDANSVAIYGASYGGYAALAGVTLTPDLYRAAVNYVGASDLEVTFQDRGETTLRTDYNFRTIWVGETKEWRDATSPINFIDRIRVPTLHAYGRNDPRVKIIHWERLRAELVRHNKDFEFIVEDEQGHGFRDPEASIRFYTAMERFFARHLAN